jgi:hypothetical protein
LTGCSRGEAKTTEGVEVDVRVGKRIASTSVSTGTGVVVLTPVTGISMVGGDGGKGDSVGVGAGMVQDEIKTKTGRNKIK